MNRRQMMTITLGSPLLLSGGCVAMVGLLRVGARGGLIRAGARSARRGRRGQLATFGRTGATTLHLMRLGQSRLGQGIRAINTLQKVGEVYGTEDEQNAVDICASDTLCETTVDGAPICTTRVDGKYLEHWSVLFGSCGHSVAEGDTSDEAVIRHWDVAGKFVGADVYENNIVRHINKNKDQVGTTQLIVTQTGNSSNAAIADDSYLRREFEKVMTEMRADHADDLADIASILQAQEECAELDSATACENQAERSADALKRLEERYRDH